MRYTAGVNGLFTGRSTAVVAAGQLSTQLGDEVVILGLKDSVYYGLNNVGTRVWQLLQTPHTIDDVVNAVVTEYEVTRETAEADVGALLADLHARGLVAITAPERA